MFEAYITNTALYPLMGIEVGTTVHFPMTTQEMCIRDRVCVISNSKMISMKLRRT